MARSGRIDLQLHARGHDRFVLDLHRLPDRLQVLVERRVVLVGLKQGDDPRGGRIHECAGDRLAVDGGRQPRQVALDRPVVLVGDRTAADRAQVPRAAALRGQAIPEPRVGVQIGRRRPRDIADLEAAEAMADIRRVADLAHLAV